MDLVEGGIISLKNANRHWNTFLTSFSNHLYGKTTLKKLGPTCVLIEEED